MMMQMHHIAPPLPATAGTTTMRNWLIPSETEDLRLRTLRLSASGSPPVARSMPPSPPPCAATTSSFSILDILNPDFGKKAVTETKCRTPSVHNSCTVPRYGGAPSPTGHFNTGRDTLSPSHSSRSPTACRTTHNRPHTQLSKGPYQQITKQARHSQKKAAVPSELSNFVGQKATTKTKTLDKLPLPCSTPLSPPPTSPSSSESGSEKGGDDKQLMWPAWVYCTRYSDRPSAGPRSRKIKRTDRPSDEKRPRTAFTTEQLARLKKEFDDNHYLTEDRRKSLALQLDLNESQIKIWFQNKRAKLKKTHGSKTKLAKELMQQGLYNHATVSGESADES